MPIHEETHIIMPNIARTNDMESVSIDSSCSKCKTFLDDTKRYKMINKYIDVEIDCTTLGRFRNKLTSKVTINSTVDISITMRPAPMLILSMKE